VAERIKASVGTHTGAGSMPAAGGIFLPASHGVQREVLPSHTRAWQIPTGARFPLKKAAKPKHTCLNLQYPPAQQKITYWSKLIKKEKVKEAPKIKLRIEHGVWIILELTFLTGKEVHVISQYTIYITRSIGVVGCLLRRRYFLFFSRAIFQHLFPSTTTTITSTTTTISSIYHYFYRRSYRPIKTASRVFRI